jgi:hypothetical protein
MAHSNSRFMNTLSRGAVCALIILFVGCASVPPGDLAKRQEAITNSGLLIEPGRRIGPLSLGMATEDVLNLLGEPDEKRSFRSDDGSVYMVEWSYWSLNLCMWIKADGTTARIEQLFTQNWMERRPVLTKFTTREGAGVGDTSSAIKRIYGSGSSELGGLDYYWGNITYDDSGIMFGLRRSDLDRDFRVHSIGIFRPGAFKPR